MIDKDRYQRTFGLLHASGDFLKEVPTMRPKHHFPIRKITVLCAAVLLLFSMASVCYAENIGGIRRTIQLWIHGDQTSAVMDIQDGQYTITYEDAQGNTHQRGGGGVAYEADGSERPLTEEELMEQLNAPEVAYLEDGTVWVYYLDHAMEITDRFNEDGICFLQLKNDDETLYLTIEYNNGYAYSSDAFIQPEEWSTSP